MNLVFVSHRVCGPRCMRFGRIGIGALAFFLFVAVPSLAWYAGYQLGGAGLNKGPDEMSEAWREALHSQRAELADARRNAEENLNALALRLGEMQARVIRLDALGQRLTRMAGLEEGEFNFDAAPAQGGPEQGADGEPIAVEDFMARMDRLAQQIEDRGQQLAVLEEMMINRNLQDEVFPTGRPIDGGWISSRFGQRTDPFSGKLEHHDGVDFAGRAGSDVIAVASGVVTWAGDRWGYGRLVEINHGNGYVTRYGHNQDILVEVGRTVKKGEVVAHMGSTGRSTGPHVHFEVLRDGRRVDPKQYIYASR